MSEKIDLTMVVAVNYFKQKNATMLCNLLMLVRNDT